MSDIDRKVAEVEGWTDMRLVPRYSTDWQWCGPLIEKYKITIVAWTREHNEWNAVMTDANGTVESARGATPELAICLAVIAAHKP
jgi:hypothetical protein